MGDVHQSEFDQTYQRAKGTPVNKKTFGKWSRKFIKEYRKEQQTKFDKKYGTDDKRDKLTGVQIFEQKAKEKLNLIALDNDDKKKNKKQKQKQKEKTVVVGDVKNKSDIKNDD